MRIVDTATGIELTPGKPDTCAGNGQTPDGNGGILECCCDQCDYLMLCNEVWADKKEGVYHD